MLGCPWLWLPKLLQRGEETMWVPVPSLSLNPCVGGAPGPAVPMGRVPPSY